MALVTFPEINAEERMFYRCLMQFRQSPVFQALLSAFASEVQALLDAAHDVLSLRQIDLAEGEQLNALGRIVGQPRIGNFVTTFWFTADSAVAQEIVDVAPAFVEGGYITDGNNLPDAAYRTLIKAKIYRNFIRYGSYLEIQEYFLQAFGATVSAVRVDPMVIQFQCAAGTPDYVKSILDDFRTTPFFDSASPGGYPATVSVDSVIDTPP